MSLLDPPVRDRSHIAPVTTREELIYLLSRASELEHNLACVYLYAAHSLKSDVEEGGLTVDQARMVRDWKRRLAGVAIEEMLHLAQVTNMLTAIGGAPHFRRSNFPQGASAFPFGIKLALEPFSRELIERLVCYEMPEDGVLPAERQPTYDAIRSRIVLPPEPTDDNMPVHCAVEPFDIDFRTVGEFYHKIATGFQSIDEATLFIGPPEAQANARFVDLDGQLTAVADCKSALAAIEMIVTQGEAPTADHPDAHFFVFDKIRIEFEDELARAEATRTSFDPVRPTVVNPMTHFYGDAQGGAIIRDELTHNVADLYNVAYDTMLLMLLRFFAHTDETEAELEVLSRGTIRMMASALRPLGEALTKMPAGAPYPGLNAGPGFGYNRDVHLLPHKNSAWIFFAERLGELAIKASYIRTHFDVPPEIEEAAAALQDIAEKIGELAPRGDAGSMERIAEIEKPLGISIKPEHNGPYLVSNVSLLTNSKGETLAPRVEMALCRCGHSRMKPFCDGSHADARFRSGKSPDRTPDKRDTYLAGALTVYDNRGTCCHAGNCTTKLPAVFRQAKEPFVDPTGADAKEIIDIVQQCPSGALGYAFADGTQHDLERPAEIYVSKDGPYHVRGGIDLKGEQRNEGASTEHYALCRCGQSKNKPFCDGSHWYAKFTDDRN